MEIIFSVVEDERFASRQILVGAVTGGRTYYASFEYRRERAESAIRIRADSDARAK